MVADPPELQVHTHDGLAWVGLTPFLLCDFHPPWLPAIPGLSTFPETNLRTYVLNNTGLDGLWFFSLDADELATVLGARALLQVPYHWAAMSVEAGSTVTYRSRRRCPPAAGHDVVMVPGAPLAAEELVERDHFLTGRWRAFTVGRPGPSQGAPDHGVRFDRPTTAEGHSLGVKG